MVTKVEDSAAYRKRASVAAEAAAWLARLQRPDRGERLEAEFRKWLTSGPSHAATFDRATQIWDMVGGISTY